MNNSLENIYKSYQDTFTPKYIRNNLLEIFTTKNYEHLPMGPMNIFIIRHGEKNYNNYMNPTNDNTFYTINMDGIKRSVNLPDFINKLGVDGYPITSIITFNPDMKYDNTHRNLSMRTESTIMIGAWLLNIPLYIFSNSNVSQPYDATTIINLFTNPIFRGKNTLIVWEHANIQSLTNMIVQCYFYFKNGGTVEKLNNATLYDISTLVWWKENTPVPVLYQNNSMTIPYFKVPYIDYMKYLPFWSDKSYDMVYFLSQNNKELTFKIMKQNIKIDHTDHIKGMIQYNYIVKQKTQKTNNIIYFVILGIFLRFIYIKLKK